MGPSHSQWEQSFHRTWETTKPAFFRFQILPTSKYLPLHMSDIYLAGQNQVFLTCVAFLSPVTSKSTYPLHNSLTLILHVMCPQMLCKLWSMGISPRTSHSISCMSTKGTSSSRLPSLSTAQSKCRAIKPLCRQVINKVSSKTVSKAMVLKGQSFLTVNTVL